MSTAKEACRSAVRAALAAMTAAERAESDAAIAARLLALPEFLRAKRIFAYWSVPPEPDTHAILRAVLAGGRTAALPVTEGHGLMHFAACTEELLPGRFGIPEPAPDAPPLTPGPEDLMLVPALAYDRQGYRLGRGGGYYDRCLAGAACRTVGLARGTVLCAALPRTWNDLPVSIVLTEKETLQCAKKGL